MRTSVLLLAASLSFSVSAQTPDDLIRCSVASDSTERLKCFDGLASKEQARRDEAAKKDLSAPKSTGDWRVQIDQSPIDDSKTVVLVSKTKDTIPGRFKEVSSPSLVLRCLRNTTSAYINFDGHHMADIQGYGKITFRVDKNKAFSRNTDVSTDNKALGFWSGGTAIPFIKQLLGGETLLIQATPFSESPITFTIDISGIDEAVKPLRETCGW
ncbi:hypothetical protein PAEH1_02780 [Paenalcaligenes hominis]|uniref:Type VI secretion system-associated protein n=1 Tax=Paenalcaligenes hominis TaxID=643674 RepID=A0A1U9JY95_9BURK|nr:type VI secretion system-associated protein TagO [Paenalcaligenes hominis]AQS50748.1 hypothetical protein PAEH1_02780 [Paenalcaligenes hominis]